MDSHTTQLIKEFFDSEISQAGSVSLVDHKKYLKDIKERLLARLDPPNYSSKCLNEIPADEGDPPFHCQMPKGHGGPCDPIEDPTLRKEWWLEENYGAFLEQESSRCYECINGIKHSHPNS